MLESTLPTTLHKNRVGHAILSGLEEIIGCTSYLEFFDKPRLENMNVEWFSIFQKQGFSLQHGSLLQEGLEQVYGRMAGRGLAIRSGRASFRYILRDFGSELGLTGLDFRLLSLIDRIRITLDSLAEFFNRDLGNCVQVEKNGDHIHWIINNSQVKSPEKNHGSICHITIGLLQEALNWASGGKIYRVEEICCSEQKFLSCVLRIHLQPFI